MKGPLFAVLAVTAIVIAVVLILIIGASPQSSAKQTQREEVELLVNSFELSDCGDAEMIGGMSVTRGASYEHISAFAAGRECIAELREAATLRGFAQDEKGELSLEISPTKREVLTIYPEGQTGESAFEWERIKL